MHLVFGFEMTVRSLRQIPFQPRGKWVTPICLGTFVMLLILTWIPTTINPYTGKCFGDIIFRPIANARTALGISVGLLFAFFTMAAIIGIQLGNNQAIDTNERIAASRMVYYLVASAILQVRVTTGGNLERQLTIVALYSTVLHPSRHAQVRQQLQLLACCRVYTLHSRLNSGADPSNTPRQRRPVCHQAERDSLVQKETIQALRSERP
jgi:hypothetical protein